MLSSELLIVGKRWVPGSGGVGGILEKGGYPGKVSS